MLIEHLPDKQLDKLMDYNRDKRAFWIARLPWYAYWAYRIKLVDLEIDAHSLYNDPMNGCPGDFMASDVRKMGKISEHLEALEYKVPYVIRMVLNYFIEAYEQSRWDEYQENCPWA